MSELNKDWVPEVGVLYKHHSGRIYEVTGLGNLNTKDSSKFPVTVIYRNVDNGTLWTRDLADWRLKFQPLKSEAEKQRDKQIEEIGNALSNAGFYGAHKSENEYRLHRLYNAGCRMTRELTDEVADNIWKAPHRNVSGINYHRVFAKAIEAHILGEN